MDWIHFGIDTNIWYRSFLQSTTQLLVTLQLFNIDSLYDDDCVFVCRWVILIRFFSLAPTQTLL